MTPSGVENVSIELAVLKNPHFDPENMFLALLEAVCDLTLTSDMASPLAPEDFNFNSVSSLSY